MKAIIYIFISVSFFSLAIFGQGEQIRSFDSVKGIKSKKIISPQTKSFQQPDENGELKPVYFNYRKRKLVCNGERMSGLDLINLCRSIPDSLIQQQIQCYDQLSNNKRWILRATLMCGVSVFVMSATASSTRSESSAYFAAGAVATTLGSGITAICSSIPHQKRKAIMFRNLPVVYNRYVEMQNQNNK